jgi:DNA replication protein DnaC
MHHIGEDMAKIKACIERMRKVSEDPQYQANVARLEAQDAEYAAARKHNIRQQSRQRGHVPVAFWDKLTNPQPTDALDAIKVFLDSPPQCVFLVLSGNLGRGKSFALGYAVQETGGEFTTAQNLAAMSSFDPLWKDLGFAHLLSIDNFGDETLNPAYYKSLYNLLDDRYLNLRKTILATNLNADTFRARYPDERLLERLRTGGTWVNLPGASMRRVWSEPNEGQ